MEEYRIASDTYYRVTAEKISTNLELFKLQYDNLYGGDLERGKLTNQVINEKWSVLYADVKTNYEKLFASLLVDHFNSFLSKVPIAKLFNP